MKQRIITGLSAAVVFVAVAIAGGWLYTALVIFLAIVGFAEFVKMNGEKWSSAISIIGYAGMIAFLLPWSAWGMEPPSSMAVVWLLMLVLLALTVVTKNKKTIDSAALMLLGALYVGHGFNAMIQVRDINEHGFFWTFLCFGCIWASDVGAYFAGRAFGKHKLWPSISPNKTIEGAIGGVVLSLIIATLCKLLFPAWIGLHTAWLIAVIAAVAGQFGDLIQSAYKRVRDIKDTGNILPGHGGILDRCDSWLIVFPLLLISDLLPN
ncbi:phosphatidate cytidylyltransferase [Paenibacillus protaetiae]|uniref:Phosphatidate cytidylyltransferase n=1 Tax=Paenibacillus protaetiae TaxID=2509456 RepID=A0A4P6ESR8_9BACL|nr:phosphatidate cytidylyltransferase [Paenibacillus protaetiae]QAY65626.1 phosphatidate cytidylyltransferase [Paenibacillus protaetiae]